MEGVIVERIPTIEAKELKKRSDKMFDFIIDLNEKLGDNEEFSEFFYEFREKEE